MKTRGLLVLLAALATVAGTVRLGFWQLDRAAQKQAMASALERQLHQPALGPDEWPKTADDARAAEHRALVAEGRWLADRTVYLDNRSMGGQAGFYVVTPLELPDRRVVLVQRGHAPRDAQDRSRITVRPPPAGPVTVEGRVAREPSRQFQLGESGHGAIRQNLDVEAFARETGLALLPWIIVQQEGARAVGDGLLRQWPQPAGDVQKNYGYAFQWFALAALVTGLYLWFQLIAPRRAARHDDPNRS